MGSRAPASSQGSSRGQVTTGQASKSDWQGIEEEYTSYEDAVARIAAERKKRKATGAKGNLV